MFAKIVFLMLFGFVLAQANSLNLREKRNLLTDVGDQLNKFNPFYHEADPKTKPRSMNNDVEETIITEDASGNLNPETIPLPDFLSPNSTIDKMNQQFDDTLKALSKKVLQISPQAHEIITNFASTYLKDGLSILNCVRRIIIYILKLTSGTYRLICSL